MIGLTARRAAALCLATVAAAAWPAAAAAEADPAPASLATNRVRSAQADPGLTPEERDAIGRAWLERLNSYYATGDTTLLPPMTPQGLDQLRAFDWRFTAVEAGAARFEETWDIFESTQWDETLVGDEQASFELRLGFDVARLAESIDAETGQVTELTDGVQRRALNATFVRGSTPDEWPLDVIGVPAGSLDLGFRKAAPIVPCPRLRDPGAARDPFGLRPWCTADGDGKRLNVGQFRPRSRFAPDLTFEEILRGCGWDAVTILRTGWPPGTPIDPNSGFRNRYVRDPKGEVPGAKRYRRSVRRPKDAVSTGVTNGHATIWTSETLGQDAILMQVGRRFERWPATSAGCADSN